MVQIALHEESQPHVSRAEAQLGSNSDRSESDHTKMEDDAR